MSETIEQQAVVATKPEQVLEENGNFIAIINPTTKEPMPEILQKCGIPLKTWKRTMKILSPYVKNQKLLKKYAESPISTPEALINCFIIPICLISFCILYIVIIFAVVVTLTLVFALFYFDYFVGVLALLGTSFLLIAIGCCCCCIEVDLIFQTCTIKKRLMGAPLRNIRKANCILGANSKKYYQSKGAFLSVRPGGSAACDQLVVMVVTKENCTNTDFWEQVCNYQRFFDSQCKD